MGSYEPTRGTSSRGRQGLPLLMAICALLSGRTGAAGNSLPPAPDAAARSPTPAPVATGALRTASSPVALDPFFAGLEERALRILYPTAPLEREAAGFGPGGNSATPAPDAIGVLRDPYPAPSDVSRSVPLDPFFADLEERTLRILYPTAPLERDAAGFGPGGTSATPAPEAIGVLRDRYPVDDAAHSVPLDPFFADLEERTFRFFWETGNPRNGLIPDRFPTPSFASISAVGFGLTAYPIGVERGYISRQAARQRVLATLRFFAGEANQHGFFYHFIDMRSGARSNESEVSTVDTALLLAGMLFCQTYFDGDDPEEIEIRTLAEEIYRRVDWTWAQPRPPAVALAWTPEGGFAGLDWNGYNEAMLVYLLALGSPTHPVDEQAWTQWTSTYDKFWGTLYDQTYLSFAPLFGHQYTHVWVDFRGIQDSYMREHGLDYFENSRRATYAQRRYAIANPKQFQGYGKNVWGMSASDGPGPARESNLGGDRRFLRYAARGVALGRVVDDGTIAPTAAISSLPFAPEIVLPAALEMYHRFGSSIYSSYGFLDAFNASFPGPQSPPQPTLPGWVDQDYIGIDQGPILAMIENYRSALVWRVMHSNSYMREGLERAGFSGGWLEEPPLGPTPPPPGPPEQYPLVQNPLAAAAPLAQSPLAPTP